MASIREFIVRAPLGGGDITIDDLGIVIAESTQIDLAANADIEDVLESDDLETLLISGDLIKVEGGLDVAASEAYDEPLNLTEDVIDALNDAYSPSSSNPYATIADVTGGGLTENTHRNLDQLVHNIAEDSFEEIIRTGNKIDQVIIWTDNGKTDKVRESTFTYTSNLITQIVTNQYEGDGSTIAETLTETITYDGNKPINIDRILT